MLSVLVTLECCGRALFRSLCVSLWSLLFVVFFFFQAEDGIRDLVRSRGLGDVYKRQAASRGALVALAAGSDVAGGVGWLVAAS